MGQMMSVQMGRGPSIKDMGGVELHGSERVDRSGWNIQTPVTK